MREQLRLRGNRAGMNIGKLEGYAFPQEHVATRVAPLKAEWVAEHIGYVDRSKYFHADGTAYSDAEIGQLVEDIATTIATEGENKRTPGQFTGNSVRANRGSQARVLHYKDAESWITAQQKYGEKSVLEIMVGHINGMARDIALVEALGPNPDHMMRTVVDEAIIRAAAAGIPPSRMAGTRAGVACAWRTSLPFFAVA